MHVRLITPRSASFLRGPIHLALIFLISLVCLQGSMRNAWAQAPAAPTNLTAIAANQRVNLSWVAVSGATSYTVLCGTATGGPYSTTVVSGATSTNYSNTGLTNGAPLFYVVKAVNSGGTSGNSNQASATPNTAPAAPTNLSATGQTGQVTLSWTPVAGATGYNIYRWTSASPQSYAPTYSSVTQDPYYNTGLTNGTTYYYLVSAVGSNGAESNQAGLVSAMPVAQPTGLTAHAGNTQVTLSWSQAASAGAVRTNIYRGIASNGEDATPIETVTDHSLTYTDSGLTNGTPYYYKVSAANGSTNSGYGESTLSAEASATPVPPLPLAPTALTAISGNQQVMLFWNSATYATSYKVQRSTSYGQGYTTIATPSGNSCTDLTAVNGVTYYYVVSGVNISGEGAISDQVSATPQTSGAANNLTAVADSYNSQASPNVNFGYNTTLYAGSPEGSRLVSYYQFDLSGAAGAITGASLKLNSAFRSTGGGITADSFSAYGVTDNSWTELGINWANQPALGSLLSTTSVNTTGGTYSWDVTSFVKSQQAAGLGLVSLGVAMTTTPTVNNYATFVPREANANWPTLVVTVGGPVAPHLRAFGQVRKIALSWNSVPGATSYTVRRSSIATGGFTPLPNGTAITGTTLTDSNGPMSDGMTYYYTVTASSSQGVGLASNVATATTAVANAFSVSGIAPDLARGTTVTGSATVSGTSTVLLSVSASSGVHVSLIDPRFNSPCPDLFGLDPSVILQNGGGASMQVCADPDAPVGPYTVTITGTDTYGTISTTTVQGNVTAAVASAAMAPFGAHMAQGGTQKGPRTLLDEVGLLNRFVSDSEAAQWKKDLQVTNPRASFEALSLVAGRHLLLGEYEMAHDQASHQAQWHFRQVQMLATPKDPIFGRAAYDTAIAQFYSGAYADSAATFRSLVTLKTALPGYDRREGALWLRHASLHAGAHAQLAAMGIPEPPRLDPMCGVAALATSLRALHLDYRKETILKVCRMTEEGNNLEDLIAAGSKLNVNMRMISANDTGLMALPKPLIAYVEKDHFISVVHADKKGVVYLCSDCGAWPGGQVRLTWSQWHAMSPGMYATVTKPDTSDDHLIAAGLTPVSEFRNQIHVAMAGNLSGLIHKRLMGMMGAADLLRHNTILSKRPAKGLTCGDKMDCQRPWGEAPMDGDPVNLATGEEEYSPKADLVVYNPNGPAVVWQRHYNSYRGPSYSYETNDFGVGWSHPYNFGVYDSTYTPYDPQVAGSGAKADKKYLYFSDGKRLEFTPASIPSSSNTKVACSFTRRGIPMRVEWLYVPGDQSGAFVVWNKDRSSWVTNGVNAGTGCYNLHLLRDCHGNGLVFNYTSVQAVTRVPTLSTPIPTPVVGGAPRETVLDYDFTPSLCSWPNLDTISDNNTGQVLLTIHRDNRRAISYVTDVYNRKVQYQVDALTNKAVPCGNPQTAVELTQVYQPVPVGTANPPVAYAYGYQNITNLEGAETTPYLHTISQPHPNGGGAMSMLTINYDTSTTSVQYVQDANGNSRWYSPANDAQTPATATTTVTIKNSAQQIVTSYTVGFDPTTFCETTRTDGAGNILVTRAYTDPNSDWQPSSIKNANNKTWLFAYDTNGFGNLVRATTPRNLATDYTYSYVQNPLGNLVRVQQGSKSYVAIIYDPNTAEVLTVTTVRPGYTGNLFNETTSYSYNGFGDLTQVVTPGANASRTTTYYYGATPKLGQVLTITDPLGHVTTMSYDEQGNAKSVKDAKGYQTDFTYVDTAHFSINVGQLQSVTYPTTSQGRSQTTYTYPYVGAKATGIQQYDESLNQIRSVTYGYDGEGRVSSIDGSTETAYYSYDGANRLYSMSDGNSKYTYYNYNPRGYLSSVHYPGYTSGARDAVQYTGYDPAGHLTDMIDGNGVASHYAYNDADDQLTQISYPGGQLPSISYTYDPGDGRLSAMNDGVASKAYTYDDLGNALTSATSYAGGPQNVSLQYYYYDDGSLSSIVTPAGSYSYQYDGAGRCSSVSNPAGETTSYGYYDNDWLQTQTLSNSVVTTYTLDAMGRTTNLATTNGANAVLSQFNAIHYNGASDITNESVSFPGVPSLSGSASYYYDVNQTQKRGQLTGEVSPATPGSSYVYDAAGNPTTFRDVTHTFNANNQDNANVYDGNGNPTTYQGATLTFDAENRLKNIAGQFSAGYMSNNLRAWKAGANNVRTYYLYVGKDPIVEMSSTGTVTAANTFGPNGLVSRHVGATTTFYTFDNRGNVAQRLSSTGTVVSTDVYDAYGKRSSPTAQTDPFGYGGQYGYYTDTETGLHYLTNRYYDANAGRFLTRDPAGYDGGINLYGYVGNNPANGADPLGLSWQDDVNQYCKQSWQVGLGINTSFNNQMVSAVFGGSSLWLVAKTVLPADQVAQMEAIESPFRTDCSEDQKDGVRIGNALGVAFAVVSLGATGGGAAAATAEKEAAVVAQKTEEIWKAARIRDMPTRIGDGAISRADAVAHVKNGGNIICESGQTARGIARDAGNHNPKWDLHQGENMFPHYHPVRVRQTQEDMHVWYGVP
jgi:RHS repeat-associated protein